MEKLEYLNLEYKKGSVRRTIDEIEISCFSLNQHKHRYHSGDVHLNTISDLCYSILCNTANLNTDINKFLEKSHKISSSCKKSFDYISACCNDLSVSLNSSTNNSGETILLQTLSDSLQQNQEICLRLIGLLKAYQPLTAERCETLFKTFLSKPKEIEYENIQLTKALQQKLDQLDQRIDQLTDLIKHLQTYLS